MQLCFFEYILCRETRTHDLNLDSYALYPKGSVVQCWIRIGKYITLKSIPSIMFANLKLVSRRYTSLYGIFMSARLTLFSYTDLLLTCCLLLLPLWESLIVLCFVVRYFMSLLVLQSSWWGRESWLLFLVCLPGVSWLLCASASRCHGFVWSLRLW